MRIFSGEESCSHAEAVVGNMASSVPQDGRASPEEVDGVEDDQRVVKNRELGGGQPELQAAVGRR